MGRRGMKFKQQAGFTLLELLVALTILSAMAGMLFGTFRMSVKAWNRGDTVVEGAQRFRIMAGLMRRQLRCAYSLDTKQPQTAISEDDATATLRKRGLLRTVGPLGLQGAPFFKGSPDSLEFTGLYSLRPFENAGLVLIAYSVVSDSSGEGYKLIEKESRYLGSDQFGKRDFSPNEEKAVMVFEGLDGASFQYFGIDPLTGAGFWEETWDSEVKGSLPGAVALDVTLKEDIGRLGRKHRFVVPVISKSFRSKNREGVRGLFQQRTATPRQSGLAPR